MIKYIAKNDDIKSLIKAILQHKENENSIIGEASLESYNEEIGDYSVTPTVIKDIVTEKAVLDYQKIKEVLSLLADYKKMGVEIFDNELKWILDSKVQNNQGQSHGYTAAVAHFLKSMCHPYMSNIQQNIDILY